ncbi:MAG TPA: metal-dependent transcriptional regulator [Longimicrobiales bacterium]|nr:metal-dependent transcriptional regulator [Longimicrobiales bacterium]
MPTPAVEDYLKAIYKASRGEGDAASTSAVADALGVSAASVSGMLRRLSERGLVSYERYYGARLTEAGRTAALGTIRRHRILESFLVEMLGYSWDSVHEEADRLEHAASEELVDRMAAALGDPAVDPHGAPIPEAGADFRERQWPGLGDLEVGEAAVVRRVSDESPEALRHLAELELRPGTGLTVIDRAPLDGPVTVRIGDAERVLGRAVCDLVRVERVGVGVEEVEHV